APRTRPRRSARGIRKLVLGVAGLLGFLTIWQLIPLLGSADPRYLPPATTALGQLVGELNDLEVWRSVRRTPTTSGTGLPIAPLGAVAIGTVVRLVPSPRLLTHTTVESLPRIPSLALTPLAILMLGLQMPAALLIGVDASFW